MLARMPLARTWFPRFPLARVPLARTSFIRAPLAREPGKGKHDQQHHDDRNHQATAVSTTSNWLLRTRLVKLVRAVHIVRAVSHVSIVIHARQLFGVSHIICVVACFVQLRVASCIAVIILCILPFPELLENCAPASMFAVASGLGSTSLGQVRARLERPACLARRVPVARIVLEAAPFCALCLTGDVLALPRLELARSTMLRRRRTLRLCAPLALGWFGAHYFSALA